MLHQFRETEIQNLDAAVFGDEQVLRLEVAMNDALFVRGRQSMSDLNAVIDCFANRHRAALQHLPQRAALQQLGDQVRCAFEDAELVDGKNVGMVESRCRLRLLLKAMQPVGVLRNKGRQDLDRDCPVSRTGSRARYTSPIPPAPNRPRTS